MKDLRSRLNEELRVNGLGQQRELKLMTQLKIAEEALERISATSYATEVCNTEEENNSILAPKVFIYQRIAKEALASIRGEGK